jgi:hypothetical protein
VVFEANFEDSGPEVSDDGGCVQFKPDAIDSEVEESAIRRDDMISRSSDEPIARIAQEPDFFESDNEGSEIPSTPVDSSARSRVEFATGFNRDAFGGSGEQLSDSAAVYVEPGSPSSSSSDGESNPRTSVVPAFDAEWTADSAPKFDSFDESAHTNSLANETVSVPAPAIPVENPTFDTSGFDDADFSFANVDTPVQSPAIATDDSSVEAVEQIIPGAPTPAVPEKFAGFDDSGFEFADPASASASEKFSSTQQTADLAMEDSNAPSIEVPSGFDDSDFGFANQLAASATEPSTAQSPDHGEQQASVSNDAPTITETCVDVESETPHDDVVVVDEDDNETSDVVVESTSSFEHVEDSYSNPVESDNGRNAEHEDSDDPIAVTSEGFVNVAESSNSTYSPEQSSIQFDGSASIEDHYVAQTQVNQSNQEPESTYSTPEPTADAAPEPPSPPPHSHAHSHSHSQSSDEGIL